MARVSRISPSAMVLAAIVVAGASVRFWGLAFGLPHTTAQPDEIRTMGAAARMLGGDLHPGFFNYPSLYLYASAALQGLTCAARVAGGAFGSFQACAASWPTAWEPFFMVGRVLTALAGTLTIVLTWSLGRRLFDTATGLAAAAFLAFAFLHVRDSHFAVTDVSMTMLVVAAVLLAVRAHDAPSRGAWLAAGAVAGLAASTKYNAVLLAVLPIVSQALTWLEAPGRRAPDSRVPAFAAAAILAFVAGSPYVLLDYRQFSADTAFEAEHLLSGHGARLAIGWQQHLIVNLWHGLTPPPLLAGLGGLAWMLAAAPRRAVLLLTFPVVYYAMAGRGYTVFARYMVPVVPFLCIGAGYAVARVRGLLVPSVGRRGADLAATAAVVLLIAPGLIKIVSLDRLLARTDSRVMASRWIAGNVPAGASVLAVGGRYGEPDLSDHGAPTRYRVWKFDQGRSVLERPEGAVEEWPEWIVTQESPLGSYSGVPPMIASVLLRYDRVQVFRAVDLGVSRVYDQQDAFFLPLAGFEGIGRPGPNIAVYRRRE